MLEGLVTWVLKNYLGKYVELNALQLSIALRSGKVELENLPLRKNALRHLGLPFDIKAGFVGKVKLQIPVTQIRSQPWVIQMEQLYLVACPLPVKDWNTEVEQNAAQELKLSALDKLEAQWRFETEQENTYYTSTYSSWLSFGTGFITDIIENLQLKIRDVHFRYEDNVSISHKGVAFGITIDSLTSQTCNESWTAGFSYWDKSDISYKLLEMQNLAVYCTQVNPTDLLSNLSLADLAVQMSLTQNAKFAKHYIISPVSAKAQIKRNRSELPLKSDSPRIICDLQLDDVPITILDVIAEETKSNEILCHDGYKYAADIKEKLQICSSNIDKIASIYSTTLYQCDRQFKALDTIDTKTNEESKFWKDFSESSQTTLKNNIERVWNARQQEIEQLNPEYDVLLSKIKKSAEVVSLCKEFYIGEVDKVISQNTESVEELAGNIKDIAIEIETEVQLTTGTSDETIKETSDLCEELTPLLESDDMKHTIDQILEMTNNVDEKLPQLINRFEQFITRDMKRVNPSGDTPVKAILNELPGDKRVPTQIMKNWASQINKYDQNHEDSFVDQDNINPDISINLESSLLSQSSILESNDATE